MSENEQTISERLRSKTVDALRRTADAIDGTNAPDDVRTVGADGSVGTSSPARRRRRTAPPLNSLRGYDLDDLPRDVAAGAVVAALSIPIAMGYAEVVGLPAIYGLYASIIAPLAFALATGTRRIVFGMDSAVSAVTGSLLVSTGLAFAGEQVGSIIGLVTILTGAFLALFSFLGAGRLARFIPVPVMHGFIAGVSLTVIVTQIPGLIGTTADMSGGFFSDVMAALGSIAEANGPSTFIAALSIGTIVHLKKTLPQVPAALVVLVITTVMCGVLHLDDDGVSILGAIDAGFPLPVLPDVGDGQLLPTVGCALVIAVVASIESLLCLETFSMKAGVRPEGSRELLSFGVGNLAAGLFGCPPCSASLSRTAAGISAGSRTQATSIFAAVIVAAVVLFLSPALYYLPRPALSAIVVVALVDVVDFEKARRYARHAMLEFVVFLISAVVVLAYGAITGVFVGTIASLIVAFYRDRRDGQQALLGVVNSEEALGGKKGPKLEASYAVLKLEGHLTFLNIDAKIDSLLDGIDDDTRAVIVKLNKVDSLDSTAADKLILLVDMLHARNMHVKIVRKVRPTNDSYTRHEMRRIMRDAKFYPNMSAALTDLARELKKEALAREQAQAAAAAAEAAKARRLEWGALPSGSVPERGARADGSLPAGGTSAERGADAAGDGVGEGMPATPDAQDGALPAILDSVSSAAHDLTDRLKNHLVKEEPFSVEPGDRIVMTVQEPSLIASEADLGGKLAYIRAREAVLFEVGLDKDDDADTEAQAPDAADAAPLEDQAGAEQDGEKEQKGKKAKGKTSKKTAAKEPGKPEKGAEKAAGSPPEKPGGGKKGAHGKKGTDVPAQSFATAVLRREKTGEVLAEYVDGAWRWYYPEEMLEPAVDLIEGLAREARK